MSKSLKEWLKDIKPMQELVEKDPEKFYGETFFRDPLRPQFIDCNYAYSPADGIIIDQSVVKHDEEIVEVKGMEYTTKKLLEDDSFDKKSLVISIFMSQYHVHVNRMPTDGNLFYKSVAPLQTLNKPMIFEERDILKGSINYANMGYPTKNGRTVNCIRNGSYEYYLVQIADSDVDVIAPFSRDQGTHYAQNARFSIVRYGSQVSLILPLTDCFDFEICEDVESVVEAGVDKLVYFKSKPDYNLHFKGKR
jgi:phosphatidylserine decarboxylase